MRDHKAGAERLSAFQAAEHTKNVNLIKEVIASFEAQGKSWRQIDIHQETVRRDTEHHKGLSTATISRYLKEKRASAEETTEFDQLTPLSALINVKINDLREKRNLNRVRIELMKKKKRDLVDRIVVLEEALISSRQHHDESASQKNKLEKELRELKNPGAVD